MAELLKLEVVTPEQYVISEDVEIVMAPGTLGEFGVLSGHTPFLTSLKPGRINYKDSTGKEKIIFVSGGFSEALPDRVTVLAESAERRRDIDLDRARAALERAQKRLAQEKSDNISFERAKIAMYRAIERIKIAETRGL
ncbi:MAG: F0F1 ATP synthase subunit epsilon [Desulfobacteraceae bacterium]|nr:F0F1 ATP synthase subunit epsilon [Desulfobacteraceae bacterium]MBC2758070.1 F0F1 ATP synthase subunit epsilon [Desulfobacteraceae bacterium]